MSPLYKERCLKNCFEENQRLTKVWEAINPIINNNKNTKKWRQISLYINNVITTDDKAIANHFKKFLTSVADKLIKKNKLVSILSNISNVFEKLMSLHPTFWLS